MLGALVLFMNILNMVFNVVAYKSYKGSKLMYPHTFWIVFGSTKYEWIMHISAPIVFPHSYKGTLMFSGHIYEIEMRIMFIFTRWKNGSSKPILHKWIFFISEREHKVMTSKWGVEPFCTKQPLAKIQTQSKSIPVCGCVCACVCACEPSLLCTPASGIG